MTAPETALPVCKVTLEGCRYAQVGTWEGEIRVDETEIAEARFFRRDEPLPMLPPPVSIARRLIDAWLAEGADRGRS